MSPEQAHLETKTQCTVSSCYKRWHVTYCTLWPFLLYFLIRSMKKIKIVTTLLLYLVIQRQFSKGRYVFGPFHQHQQLLPHGVAHIPDSGSLLLWYVCYSRWSSDLMRNKAQSHVHTANIRRFTWQRVTCWEKDSAWAKILMVGRSWESGMLLLELIRSLSFCTATTQIKRSIGDTCLNRII